MPVYVTVLNFAVISGLPSHVIQVYLHQGKLPFLRIDKFIYIHLESGLKSLRIIAEENAIKTASEALVGK